MKCRDISVESCVEFSESCSNMHLECAKIFRILLDIQNHFEVCEIKKCHCHETLVNSKKILMTTKHLRINTIYDGIKEIPTGFGFSYFYRDLGLPFSVIPK